jgi:putative membrane protein
MSADLRILQANERTLLAWLRTTLSLITFGVVIAHLPEWAHGTGRVPGPGTPEIVGAAFVVMGALGDILALVRFAKIRAALLVDRPVPTGGWAVVALSMLVGVIGLVLAGWLLLLR